MTVRSGRAFLHVEVAGQGESTPVVFLHAAVADSRMWHQSMDHFASTATLIAYDRRGFGHTKYEAEDYSSVSDLIAVIDSLVPSKPVVLVGCSQGGRIALDATLEHPERIAGLVLVAPNVPGAPEIDHPPATEELLAAQAQWQKIGDIDRLNQLKARLWLDGPLSNEGRVVGKPRDLLLEMNSLVLNAAPAGTDLDTSRLTPAFNRLSEIEVQTLVIWGDLEFPHITARCQLLARKIRNCLCLELKGTAHLPSLDQPEAIASALTLFLAQLNEA